MRSVISNLIIGVSAAALAWTAAPVLAQPETTLREPARTQFADGSEALQRAIDALKDVRAMSYAAEVSPASKAGKPVLADVSLLRADAGGWKVYCRGGREGEAAGGEGANFEIGYDAVTARAINPKDKTVAERSPKNLEELKVFFSEQQARQPIAWELLEEKPFDGAAGAKLVGRTQIAGKTCEIVVVERAGGEDDEPGSKAGGGVKLFIDDDGLVRRVERFRGPWDAPLATRVLDLNDLKINQAAKGATFALEVPDGYRVKASKGNRLGGGGEKKAGPGIQGVPASDRTLLAVGSKAPDFSLQDPHDGKNKSLKDYAGKVLVVDFWAVWCKPCKMIMPGLQKVHEKFKDKPVAVVGFSSDEKGSDAVAFKKKNGYTYGLLVEVDAATSRKYRVQGIPTIYVISPKGEIVWGKVGGGDPTELEGILTAIIEDQLKKMDGAGAQEPEKKKEAAKPAEPAKKKKGAFDDDDE